MPRAGSLGLVGKLALAVVLFVVLDRAVDDYTLAFLALAAVSLALLSAWVLDILIQIVSYYRHGTRSKTFGAVLRREVNRRTPQTDRVTTYAVALLAGILVVSATLGTGIAVVDSQTPSYEVAVPGIASGSDSGDMPANESRVGGSFERIRLDETSNRITLFVDNADGIDAVVIVDPSGRQIASERISAGTRRVDMDPARPFTNGTYEIVGVGYDVNSENILLSQAEERESHEVRLNTTA